MREWIRQFSVSRRTPRLWVERLVLFSEASHEHRIRTVSFLRGLNLVWAKEPEPGSAQGTRAAGHGVGKTSLCLLLRLCMGDTAKAVTELRETLFSEFPRGGVAVLLHLEGQPFILFRYFSVHKEGIALPGADIAALWGDASVSSDQVFLQQLADTMMKWVTPRVIPETGQSIEWRHVLAWISRDQGARFKSFFAWREGEGTGLQRNRQDPPIIMRAVLGLLEQSESDLMKERADLETKLALAKQATETLLQEPTLIRRRIESNLRVWCKASDDLPLYSEDLFGASVERQVQQAADEAKATLADWNTRQDEAEQALADTRVELKLLQRQFDKAEMELELADAARKGDEAAYRAIGEKLLNLKQLAGDCREGNIPFSQCRHILAEIGRLQGSRGLRDARDEKNLQRAMTEFASRAGEALQRKQEIEAELRNLDGEEAKQLAKRNQIRAVRDRTANEAYRGAELFAELERWKQSAGSSVAQEAIDQSQARISEVKRATDNVLVRLEGIRYERSEREQRLNRTMEGITQELLPDAVGTFDPRDENRPFRLSVRGGEAYRVLEVLLGDIACLMESAESGNAFPGFVIHDCPREADMGIGLYQNFLRLVGHLQGECFGKDEPAFQYIVTTTSPPPEELLGSEPVRLVLDPSSDEGFLFRRRFSNGE